MSEEFSSPRPEDQFREFFGIFRRRKAILIGGVFLGLGLGVAAVLLATPSYQVNARILLQKYDGGSFRSASDPVDRVTTVGVPPDIGAQIGLLQSPEVLQDAFSQANVSIRPGDEITGQIVSIDQENTTPVLQIHVNLPDPDGASRLAQAIPASYNAYAARANERRTSEALANLRNKVATSRAALNRSQAAYERFLADQGQGTTISAIGGGGPERTQRLGSFEQQLEGARIGVSTAQTALAQSQAALAQIPKEIADTAVRPSVELRRSQEKLVADLTADLKAALVTSTEAAPEVRALRVRLKEQQDYLAKIPPTTDYTGKVINPVRAGYEQRVFAAREALAAAQAQVTKLTKLVDTERAAVIAYQKRVPQQRQLENDLDEKRATLASASQNFASLQVLTESKQPAVQVLQISGAYKTQPVIPRTLVSATLLGLIFGVIAAMIRDRFDNRVHTLEQIYDSSGVLPIGQVSVAGKPLALESGRNRSRALESYRSLRFNLETSGATGAVQSVLVASASAGEGRSSLAWNLASEAATDMRKTILVDGDMRTPELHERLKVARGPGLSEVLSGAVALQDVLKETGQENLLFLSSGAEHANPLELLTGPSLASVHEALKEMADVVIFNSPSLMRYTDGRALARVTDSVVFVAKRGFTRRDAMRYCVGMLRRAKARLLGVVLVDESGRTSDVPYFATE